MLSTNILPPEEKKNLFYEDARRITLFFAVSTVIIFIIGSLLLLPAFIPVEFERRQLARAFDIAQQTSVQLRVGETTERVRVTQASIGSLRASATISVLASSVLKQFLENQNGISVAALTVKKTGEFNMSGVAKTRRELLQFEKWLRDGGQFRDISSPLSNIIREFDINFSIQGKLKKTYGE